MRNLGGERKKLVKIYNSSSVSPSVMYSKSSGSGASSSPSSSSALSTLTAAAAPPVPGPSLAEPTVWPGPVVVGAVALRALSSMSLTGSLGVRSRRRRIPPVGCLYVSLFFAFARGGGGGMRKVPSLRAHICRRW